MSQDNTGSVAPFSSRSSRRLLLPILVLFLSGLFSLPTAAQPAGLPLETFSAPNLPAGWTVENDPGAVQTGWRTDNPGNRPNRTGGAGGFISADSDYEGQGVVMDTRLRTPLLNLSGINSVQLRFRTYFQAFENSSGDVDISTDGGQSWATVESYTGVNTEGTITLNLSDRLANQPQAQISFRYRGTWAYEWQLDDIELLVDGAPAAPTGLAAAAAGDANRIDLNWTDASASETAFLIERSPDGVTGWAELATVPADTVAYSDQRVGCGATYAYRVRAASAAGRSPYSAVASATTLACPALVTLSESFAGGGLPAGWSNVDFGQDPSQGRVWRFDDPAGRVNRTGGAGGFALADSGYFGGVTNVSLRTPAVNFSNTPFVELSFKSFFRRYDDPNLGASEEDVAQVYVSVDGGQSFAQPWGVPSSFAGTRTLDLSNLAGGRSNVVVEFYYRGDRDYFWQIDDVELRPMPAAPTPSNLSASLGENGRVNLTWNTGGAASYVTFEVERQSPGGAGWEQISQAPVVGAVFTDDSPKTAGSSYSYRVRAVNRAGVSNYSLPAQVNLPGAPAAIARTFDITISYYGAIDATKEQGIRTILGHFADAIYEMTNGVHRLGRISIYPNGGAADRAEIIWVQRCWPNASTSGLDRTRYPGGRVEFCDIWNSNPPQDHFASPNDLREGGYTLGHEYGHYAYSQLDEYANTSLPCANRLRINQPCAEDSYIPFSIMSESFNAARQNDARYLNFSTATTNTGDNAQRRVYGASAWETLARPLEQDPRDGARSTQPVRIYWPELAAVAPGAGEIARLELPGAQANARAALAIDVLRNPSPAQVTAGLQTLAAPGGVVRQLVIDASSRDGGGASDLEAFKAAARRLVDRAALGDTLGIISFDGAVSVRLAPTVIASDGDRAVIKAAIDAIQAGNAAAATGAALQRALDELSGFTADSTAAVYLITGGPHTTGAAPFSLVGAYQSAGVKLFALGYVTSERLSAELQELAAQTGGAFTYIDGSNGDGSPTGDLLEALSASDRALFPQVRIALKADSALVDSTAPITVPLVVDASLAELEVTLTHREALGNLTATLIDPAGASRPVTCSAEQDTEFPEVLCYLRVAASTGVWQLRLQAAQGLSMPVDYAVSGVSKQDSVALAASVAVVEGKTVNYPEPIVIAASVGTNRPITNARVVGQVEAPDGAVLSVLMLDDGRAPDELAGDGIYSGIVRYHLDGIYNVTVSFDNSAGTAEFTDLSTEAQSGRVPETTPVGANFERVTSFQITASGYESDDHKGWPEEATPLAPDNSDVSGQIDYADDVDAFRVTVPQGYNGELVVRVTGLGFDMDPFVYITDSIFSFARTGYFNYIPSGEDYLTVPLKVTAGQELYIYLQHFSPSADTGVYRISVGPELAREQVTTITKVELLSDERVYLPTVRR